MLSLPSLTNKETQVKKITPGYPAGSGRSWAVWLLSFVLYHHVLLHLKVHSDFQVMCECGGRGSSLNPQVKEQGWHKGGGCGWRGRGRREGRWSGYRESLGVGPGVRDKWGRIWDCLTLPLPRLAPSVSTGPAGLRLGTNAGHLQGS